jgi:hypothetical protein
MQLLIIGGKIMKLKEIIETGLSTFSTSASKMCSFLLIIFLFIVTMLLISHKQYTIMIQFISITVPFIVGLLSVKTLKQK